MAFGEARKTQDLQRIQQNVDWLLEGRIFDDQGNLVGWGYGKSGEPRPGRITPIRNTHSSAFGRASSAAPISMTRSGSRSASFTSARKTPMTVAGFIPNPAGLGD